MAPWILMLFVCIAQTEECPIKIWYGFETKQICIQETKEYKYDTWLHFKQYRVEATCIRNSTYEA